LCARKPFGLGFHHFVLFVFFLLGAFLVMLDRKLFERASAEYWLGGALVTILMGIQYHLDLRHIEEEYLALTSVTPVRLPTSEWARAKWPALAVVPLSLIFGVPYVVGVAFMLFLAWYPMQRRYYLRSHREFGAGEQSGR
jgi:hypothetical protein